MPLDNFDFERTKIGKRLPIVLSRDETKRVISNLEGEFQLMASLLYGSGLRLTECLKLRVKDIDFDLYENIVRGGKGDNDRRSLLPSLLIPQLNRQIEKARLRLEENLLVDSFTGASMPEALGRKYPNAPKELAKMPPAIHSVIHLLRICLRMVMTFVLYKSYWVIKMFEPL